MGNRRTLFVLLCVAYAATTAAQTTTVAATTTVAPTTTASDAATTKDNDATTTVNTATTIENTATTVENTATTTVNNATTTKSTATTTKSTATTIENTGTTVKTRKPINDTEYKNQLEALHAKLLKNPKINPNSLTDAGKAKMNNTGKMDNKKNQFLSVVPYEGNPPYNYKTSYGVLFAAYSLRWQYQVYLSRVKTLQKNKEYFMSYVSEYHKSCFKYPYGVKKGLSFGECLNHAAAINDKKRKAANSFYYDVESGRCELYEQWRFEMYKTCWKARGANEVAFYMYKSQPKKFDPCGGVRITVACTDTPDGRSKIVRMFFRENYCMCRFEKITIAYLDNLYTKRNKPHKFSLKNFTFTYPDEDAKKEAWLNNSHIMVYAKNYKFPIAASYFRCDYPIYDGYAPEGGI